MKKLTTEEFIAKARAVHGERYDYSRAVYGGNKGLVTVNCLTHGPFALAAGQHLSGGQCQKCSRKKSGRYMGYDTSGFVIKAIAVHGGKYDYSRVVYTNASSKVEITCHEHGVFLQKPGQHLIGKGCGKCANKTRTQAAQAAQFKWTTEAFRLKAKELHPALDFSNSEYLGNEIKTSVTCIEHGLFMAHPNSILAMHGCKKCGFMNASQARALTRAEVIKKFQHVHGLYYIYDSLPDYPNSGDKQPIVCPAHGVFYQTTSSHMSGSGCPSCARVKLSDTQKLGSEYYLAKFLEVHGDAYSYPAISPNITAKDKIDIICPEHGKFRQEVWGHSKGRGCRKCYVKKKVGIGPGWRRSSWMAVLNGRAANLYVVELTNESEIFYKVGITCREIRQRFNKSMPYKARVLASVTSYDGAYIYDLENDMHRRFKHLKYSPQLRFDGQQECFTSATEILASLPESTVFYEQKQQQQGS